MNRAYDSRSGSESQSQSQSQSRPQAAQRSGQPFRTSRPQPPAQRLAPPCRGDWRVDDPSCRRCLHDDADLWRECRQITEGQVAEQAASGQQAHAAAAQAGHAGWAVPAQPETPRTAAGMGEFSEFARAMAAWHPGSGVPNPLLVLRQRAAIAICGRELATLSIAERATIPPCCKGKRGWHAFCGECGLECEDERTK